MCHKALTSCYLVSVLFQIYFMFFKLAKIQFRKTSFDGAGEGWRSSGRGGGSGGRLCRAERGGAAEGGAAVVV